MQAFRPTLICPGASLPVPHAPAALPHPFHLPGPRKSHSTPLPNSLPKETIATAVVVFHRFFAERSLSEYQASQRLDVVLMTCLFLAAKVEEQPRRIRDAINCVYFARKQLEALRTAAAASVPDEDDEDDEQDGGGKEGGRNGRDARQQDETKRRAPPPPPAEAEDAILPLDRGYWEMKESVVDTEQLVLRVLGFDLDTYQPYRLLLNYARSLRARPLMVEVAWALLNDSLFSPACCLLRPPQAQAVAALHLAQRMLVVQEQQQEGQQQRQQETKAMQISESSNSRSSKERKHTFVISSRKSSGRNTSSELTVDREMWAVLGAKAEDVKACCHELLTLYEGGVGLSPPVWAKGESGEKGGGGVGRREGGNGVEVGMEDA